MADHRPSATDSQQTRAYAGYYGVWVGLCWSVSFGLSMAGLIRPELGNVGLLTGAMSLPLAVWLLRTFRDQVAPLPPRRAWHLAWQTLLCAALICTIVQFIYFSYIDGGRFVQTYSEMMAQPEMHDAMQQLLPGQDVDALVSESLSAFSSLTVSELTLQFLFWNVILATVLAVPVMLLSCQRGTSTPPERH